MGRHPPGRSGSSEKNKDICNLHVKKGLSRADKKVSIFNTTHDFLTAGRSPQCLLLGFNPHLTAPKLGTPSSQGLLSFLLQTKAPVSKQGILWGLAALTFVV